MFDTLHMHSSVLQGTPVHVNLCTYTYIGVAAHAIQMYYELLQQYICLRQIITNIDPRCLCTKELWYLMCRCVRVSVGIFAYKSYTYSRHQ